MYKFVILLTLGVFFSHERLTAQATLPGFTLKNTNGRINILWLNQYPGHVNGISIQRSYDSLTNFSSIASVINPQNMINGYTDENPPYQHMYYRLFIGFDTGTYIFTASKRPELNSTIDYNSIISEVNALYEKAMQLQSGKEKKSGKPGRATKSTSQKKTKPEAEKDAAVAKPPAPSKWIYPDKTFNIVISLPDVTANKYRVKFLTDDNRSLFELKQVPDDYSTLEKVNFTYAGWYKFRIYKDEMLFEENKIFIPKDIRKPGSGKRSLQ